jgi:hypothetical protein
VPTAFCRSQGAFVDPISRARAGSFTHATFFGAEMALAYKNMHELALRLLESGVEALRI